MNPNTQVYIIKPYTSVYIFNHGIITELFTYQLNDRHLPFNLSKNMLG